MFRKKIVRGFTSHDLLSFPPHGGYAAVWRERKKIFRGPQALATPHRAFKQPVRSCTIRCTSIVSQIDE
jgi:hypothetical protein